MKSFIHDNFLLENKTAQELYHDVARNLPIIDYHNHLPPADIARDRSFRNITEAWIEGDHYKWRAMRTVGIDEHFITGSADSESKFKKWALTAPATIRNPLFHWTALELKRYFDIDELLSPDSASNIYKSCNEALASDGMTARGLLRMMNVNLLCTTDDPADDLRHHQRIHEACDFRVLPAFRPDRYIDLSRHDFFVALEDLGRSAECDIKDLDNLIDALNSRMNFFQENGCMLSDHGLTHLSPLSVSRDEASGVFERYKKELPLTALDREKFKSFMMYFLGRSYANRSWVMQLHLGAMRNNNSKQFNSLGRDTGFDSIGQYAQVHGLQYFLDQLNSEGCLPQTIVYNLNPADSPAICTMLGNFQGSARGKLQYGAAWWFLDQYNGITEQLDIVSNMSLLSTFIGMLTDSRSFLSFPRHEYFRRILCQLLGSEMERGLLPMDKVLVGNLVSDLCYNNSAEYFGLNA